MSMQFWKGSCSIKSAPRITLSTNEGNIVKRVEQAEA